jgi:predicted ATPase
VKLADFFVECARTGRQIFIETHSEHLINRLRLAIAQDESGDTRNLVSVLFASQDESTGITQYKNAVINDLGGVEGDGWPPNFLDLSTDQGLELLKEAVARRQRKIFADEHAALDDDDDF